MTDTFLRELDRLQAATAGRLAIIGSAYRIDVVDQALIKDKSRFNRKVFLPPPDEATRREVLTIYLGRTPNDGRLDAAAIAARTEGYVGWDLENVVKKAALRAIEADRRKSPRPTWLPPCHSSKLGWPGDDRGLPVGSSPPTAPSLQFQRTNGRYRRVRQPLRGPAFGSCTQKTDPPAVVLDPDPALVQVDEALDDRQASPPRRLLLQAGEAVKIAACPVGDPLPKSRTCTTQHRLVENVHSIFLPLAGVLDGVCDNIGEDVLEHRVRAIRYSPRGR
jgi:SpoVK/Ycf46/Vps4 family AAA+-type ATPase